MSTMWNNVKKTLKKMVKKKEKWNKKNKKQDCAATNTWLGTKWKNGCNDMLLFAQIWLKNKVFSKYYFEKKFA